MDMLVASGVAVIIEALLNKAKLPVLAPKLAKVYVAIERAAMSNSALASAINRAREK